MTVDAVPVGTLRDASGRVVPMKDGPCLWCGQYVESNRDMAGATDPLDPCWQIDGDFGCYESPESSEDGCGDHARPFDVARMILGYGKDGRRLDRALLQEKA